MRWRLSREAPRGQGPGLSFLSGKGLPAGWLAGTKHPVRGLGREASAEKAAQGPPVWQVSQSLPGGLHRLNEEPTGTAPLYRMSTSIRHPSLLCFVSLHLHQTFIEYSLGFMSIFIFFELGTF